LLVKMVKDQPLDQLLAYLPVVPKKSAGILLKTLKTALADAKHNFDLELDKLRLKEIRVDEGLTMKRWRPVSRGRAHGYKKRTSHLTVILEGEK